MADIVSLATLAPWGVALPHPTVMMTADELLHMGDDSRGYELIEGKLVSMPPTDFDHADMTAELTMVLRTFVKAHHLGTVLTGEPGFLISHNPDTILASDVAFVRTEHAPPKGSPQRSGFFTIIPARDGTKSASLAGSRGKACLDHLATRQASRCLATRQAARNDSSHS